MPEAKGKKEWVLEDKVMPLTRYNITPYLLSRRPQEKLLRGSTARMLRGVVAVQLPAVLIFSLDVHVTRGPFRARAPSRRDRNITIHAP